MFSNRCATYFRSFRSGSKAPTGFAMRIVEVGTNMHVRCTRMATRVMTYNSSRDSDFDLNTRFEGDRSDLFDDFAGRVEVNKTFVDLHFESVPGF